MAARKMKPPGGECHDLFGADFNGSPSHHRVLKPPGGGTSDIFGPAETVEQPRKVRHQLTSSLFLGDHEDNPTPSKPKPGNDSFQNLFGEPDPWPPSAVKNRMKSNIFLDDSATTNCSTSSQKISFPYQSSVLRNDTTPTRKLFGEPDPWPPSAVKNRTMSNIFLDDSATTNCSTASQKISFPYQSSILRNGTTPTQNGNGTSTPAGNPVTGEGYKREGGVDKPDGSASSPTPSQPAMNGTTSAPSPRQRVPPGGFSSGLW